MIKLLLCDVDGTLTDGVYQMGEDGSLVKGFFSRDFHGLYMLHETGVKVGILTYSRDGVIEEQCRRAAKFVDVMVGAKNKLNTVYRKYVRSGDLTWDEIAFIGDDVVDSDLLGEVGLPGCPGDAYSGVTELVMELDDGFVSKFNSGRGAVRDFTDYIRTVNGEKS